MGINKLKEAKGKFGIFIFSFVIGIIIKVLQRYSAPSEASFTL